MYAWPWIQSLVPQKVKTELPCDSAIVFLSTFPKGIKFAHKRDACMPMLLDALFKIAKIRNNAGANQGKDE